METKKYKVILAETDNVSYINDACDEEEAIEKAYSGSGEDRRQMMDTEVVSVEIIEE